MRNDATSDPPDRIEYRGQMLRRSAKWNISHELDEPVGTGTQSIHRALTLLHLLGVMARDRPDGVALSELSQASRRPKASVHRVITTLVQMGYVERVEPAGRYRLGLQSQILGELAGERTDPLIRVSVPGMLRLAELSEDTTFLTVRQGSFSICARREEGYGEIRNNALAVGDRHPLGIGAGSLAILAGLPDHEVAHVLELNEDVMNRRYPQLSVSVLRSVLERTRHDGYALNEGLVAPGSWAIGVVIHVPGRGPAAALSIASIEARLSHDRREELVAVMKKEAALIEAALTNTDDGVDPRRTSRRTT